MLDGKGTQRERDPGTESLLPLPSGDRVGNWDARDSSTGSIFL